MQEMRPAVRDRVRSAGQVQGGGGFHHEVSGGDAAPCTTGVDESSAARLQILRAAQLREAGVGEEEEHKLAVLVSGADAGLLQAVGIEVFLQTHQKA